MKTFVIGIIILIQLFCITSAFGQTSQINELEQKLMEAKTKDSKYYVLLEIGQIYQEKSPQKAMPYFRRALLIATQSKNDRQEANALLNLAKSYFNLQKYFQAQKLFKKSLKIYLKYNDSIRIADLYKNIGSVFFATTVYDSTLYYELKAFRIYQNYQDYHGIMSTSMILGSFSSEINNFNEANYYFEQAINNSKKINNTKYECDIYYLMGQNFSKQNFHFIAITIFKKALKIAQRDDKRILLGDINKDIAKSYLLLNQTQLSLVYYYKAKQYYEEFNNINGIFDISVGLAELYNNTDYYKMSYGFLLKANSLLKNYESYLNINSIVEYYDIYSQILIKMNKPTKAYNALLLKEKYQGELMDKQKIRLVYELEFKYKTISKNKKIENLKEINRLNLKLIEQNEAKREAERKIVLLFVIIGVILLISSLLIYGNFLRNRKLSKKIQEKNKKIFEAQQKLKRIVDFLPVVFFEADSNGSFVFKNLHFDTVMSITEEINTLDEYYQYIKPVYREKVKTKIANLDKPGDIQSIEFEFERKDNTSFWALLTFTIKEINGKNEFYGMIIDISNRKKIEQDLLLLKTSVEQSGSPLIITDSDAKIVYVNSAYLKITGYKEDELFSKNPSILKSKLTSNYVYNELWETITAGKVWRGTFINRKKDGELFTDKTIITPIINKNNKITHYVANKEDITDEARKNEKILKLFTATENSPNSVMILDSEMKITYVNKAFEKTTGYKADEVLGLIPNFLDSNKHNSGIVSIIEENIYKGNIWQGMLINKKKNGTEFWNSSTIIPLSNEDNELIGIVCNDTDITEQIKTQQELMDTMDKLNEKNQEIFSSIRYAERIQKAVISNEAAIKTLFAESFAIYLPRDIISGDFFWVAKKNNKHYAIVVDCTGHSVPGAFLSIIGVNLLDSAIIERGIEGPSNVLNYMSKKLFEILSNSYSDEHIKDDMEVAIVEINYDKKELLFASSRNRLYYVTNNDRNLDSIDKVNKLYNDDKNALFKINGNREFLATELNDKKFTDFKIDINNNDIFFMSSDGYYDQFGGEKSMKYKRKKFENRLFDISQFPVEIQKKELLNEFYNYKGVIPQTDDVTVVGIRIVLDN